VINTDIAEDFEMMEQIGEGAFATVRKARSIDSG
jgi:hypothetical protein